MFELIPAIEGPQGFDLKPMLFEQRGVLSGAREVPRVPRRITRFPQNFTQRLHDVGDVPFTTHLENESAPWLQRPRDTGDHAPGIRDPVERGIGEDGVEWLVEPELPCVSQREPQLRIV